MTDAYFYPRWAEQEGWTEPTVQTFKIELFGGININPNREFITRFFDVDLPSGATITAAYVNYYMYAKDPTVSQNFTYDYAYEATAVGGTTIRQDATPLRQGVYEQDTANRTWSAALLSNQTFTWNTSLGNNQLMQVDVTSIIQQAFNTNSGRHMTLAFKMKVLTETGNIGVGNNANGYKQRLLIQYTGGTARNEVVHIDENAKFTSLNGDVPSSGAPSYWYNNQVFGTYQASPTYTVASSFTGIAASPTGGSIFQITSTVDNQRAVSWHQSPNDLKWGTWYCWSIWAYVPTGVSDVKIASLQNLFNDNGRLSTKDTWVRLYIPYLASPDTNPLIGVGSLDNMMTGQSFYLAGHNLTEGITLYPYFDGDTTYDATHHRTFEWGGGTTGKRNSGPAYVILDSNPTVTGVSPQPSQSTQKLITSYWNYSDTYGESESRHRIEIRKKRVP